MKTEILTRGFPAFWSMNFSDQLASKERYHVMSVMATIVKPQCNGVDNFTLRKEKQVRQLYAKL